MTCMGVRLHNSHKKVIPVPAIPIPVNQMSDTSKPMQLGLMRHSLSAEERLCRRKNNLWLYCREASHYVCSSPAKLPEFLSISPSNYPSPSANATHLALTISFQLIERTISVTPIIGSGACSYFIDLNFAAQQHVSRQQTGSRTFYLFGGWVLYQIPSSDPENHSSACNYLHRS